MRAELYDHTWAYHQHHFFDYSHKWRNTTTRRTSLTLLHLHEISPSWKMPPSRIVPRFVNITNPKEFGISGKDPAVRSHVTRYQWQSHHARKEAARKRRREQFLPIRIELDCAALNLNAEMNPSEEDQASHAVLQPIPRLLGGFRVDLFRSYPVWRPVFAPLVDYCACCL